jgi:hypothetical protein
MPWVDNTLGLVYISVEVLNFSVHLPFVLGLFYMETSS